MLRKFWLISKWKLRNIWKWWFSFKYDADIRRHSHDIICSADLCRHVKLERISFLSWECFYENAGCKNAKCNQLTNYVYYRKYMCNSILIYIYIDAWIYKYLYVCRVSCTVLCMYAKCNIQCSSTHMHRVIFMI